MTGYKQGDAAHGYEQAVDAHPEDYLWSDWSVYPDYDVDEGGRYLYVPMAEPAKQIFGRRRYRPLSRPTAALFLEFARWPETEGMDPKPFDTPRNEAAAKGWAEIHGVLGLSSSPFEVFDEASHAIGHSLGAGGAIRPRLRNEGRGGRKETVASFAIEAWIAHITLRLYEAATNPDGPNLDAIAACMPDREEDLPSLQGVSTRSLHGKSPERARSWALQVVEEIVEDRIRGHVWPISVRDYNGRGDFVGHRQGWAFGSLLGAMWLQMMWLMLGQGRRCDWCGKLLDVDPEENLRTTGAGKAGRRKPPSHKRFCRGATCRQKWNYHHGTGKSSKASKKEKRGRERRES